MHEGLKQDFANYLHTLALVEKGERETAEAMNQLYIEGQRLSKMVSEMKVLAATQMQPLADFLNNDEMFKYNTGNIFGSSTESNQAQSKRINRVFYPRGGNHSPETVKAFKESGLVNNNGNITDEGHTESLHWINTLLAKLVVVYKMVEELEKITKYESEDEETAKAAASQANLIISKYLLSIEDGIKKFSNTGTSINELLLKEKSDFLAMDEEVAKAFNTSSVKSIHITKMNDSFKEIIRKIMLILGQIKMELYSRQMIAFIIYFPNFREIRDNMEERVQKFFQYIVINVNETEKLADDLTSSEDKDLAETQHLFMNFINNKMQREIAQQASIAENIMKRF